MPYVRTAAQKRTDFAAARAFEEEAGGWLGDFKVANLTATDKLDYWIPPVAVDIKEKRQKLTSRWWVLPDVDEVNLFVLDELSIRRAATTPLLAEWPLAYFLIRDVPGGNRIFLARIDEVFTADRVRRDRDGKGKWIVDLSQFRQLHDPAVELLPTILSDLTTTPWKQSGCLSLRELVQI